MRQVASILIGLGLLVAGCYVESSDWVWARGGGPITPINYNIEVTSSGTDEWYSCCAHNPDRGEYMVVYEAGGQIMGTILEDYRGSVVVSFPKVAALKIVSRMTGVETKVFDDDVTDAVGELVNIIAGNAKEGLQQFRIEISLPSVVKGPQHTIAWMVGVPVIAIPLASEFGTIYLFVSMRES